MMYDEPATLHALLELLADVDAAVSERADRRRRAGGDDLRYLGRRADAAAVSRVLAAATCSASSTACTREREGRRVPVILFTKGGGAWLRRDGANRLRRAGRRLDDGSRGCAPRRATTASRCRAISIRTACMPRRKRFATEVARVLASYGRGHGHVFNLGHGIHPGVPPEHAGAMIAAVHELSPPYHDVTDVQVAVQAPDSFGNSSRSARRRILPTFVFGSSFLKYTCRGTL